VGNHWQEQVNRITLRGAQGSRANLAEFVVPSEYEVADLAGEIGNASYNVGHAYAQLLLDLAEGTHVVPTFADAVRRHRFLERVDPASAT